MVSVQEGAQVYEAVAQYLQLSKAAIDQGDFSGAVHAIRQALVLVPENPAVLVALGCVYKQQGNLDEACRHLKKATQVRPEYADAHRVLAATLILHGRTSEAETTLQQLLQLNPGDSNARQVLNRLYFDAGQYQECLTNCYEASQQDPASVETALTRAACFLQVGKTEQSRKIYAHVLENTSPDGQVPAKQPMPVSTTAAPTSTQINVPPNRPMMYLGDHTALTTTAFGQKIYVDTRDVSLAPHILLSGHWEPWFSKWFAATVKQEMVVVDIGANVGYFTLLAAAGVGPKGKVIAFEANPRLSRLVYRSIHVNGFWDRAKVENLGVMDRAGNLQFHINNYFQGGSNFFSSAGESDPLGESTEEVSVRCVSLDDYFGPQESRIDLIKIDAEGAELQIITGARELLQNRPPRHIVMEFSPYPHYKAAAEILLTRGYQMALVGVDSTLHPVTLEQLNGECLMVSFYLE